MGLIIRAICQVLIIQAALQCHQARLELADQAFADRDNAYQEENDGIDLEKTDLVDEGKDTNNVEMEADDETTEDDLDNDVAKFHEDLEDKIISDQQRRAKAQKRRWSKKERMRTRHHQTLNYHDKDPEMSVNPAEEESDNREIANFYLTNPSEIANVSEMLGPGPVNIQITDPTTQKKTAQNLTTQKPVNSSTIIGNTTRLGPEEMRSVANISLGEDEWVSLVGEHKRGHKRKFKQQSNARKDNAEFLNWNDKVIPLEHRKKKCRLFHKQISTLDSDDREKPNPRPLHKKRKYMKIHKKPQHIIKNSNKYNFNEEGEYTNVSIINKSFQSAKNKFDLKNRVIFPPDCEAPVDTISDEEANKLNSKNTEREIRDEGEISLRDDPNQVEKENYDLDTRINKRKGIWSKIEHEDWINHITLSVPDYSIRKKKKNKLSSLFSLQKFRNADGDNRNSNSKKKKSVETLEKREGSMEETQDKDQGEDKSDKVKNEYVFENTREERDIKSRGIKDKFQKGRSIFKRNKNKNYEKEDELYDTDTKLDERGYPNSFKNNGDNTYLRQDVSEKADDYYGANSNFVGGEKSITEVCMYNLTTQETISTCVSTSECALSTKPTRKTMKQKCSSKPVEKPEPFGNFANVSGDKSKTEYYEMFLSGQLADNFVDEVIRKVKSTRKISRELGYSNETEETCDRCIELKMIKIPEMAAMRSSLRRCANGNSNRQNSPTCYAVPKPMEKFLDVLVFYEKENENRFYSKIQDDSTFIFTGDYSEPLSKDGNSIKIKEKYAEESSFNKDTFDKQRLKDDVNEEKIEDKIESFDPSEKPKGQLSEEYYSADGTTSGFVVEKIKENQGEIKRYQRRFSKNKIEEDDRNNQETFSNVENVRDLGLSAEFNLRGSNPLAKDNLSNKYLGSNTYHRGSIGENWKEFGETSKENPQNPLNVPKQSEKNPLRHYDRFYGESNYNYLKQYPSKNSPSNSRDSSKNVQPTDGRDHYGFYNPPNSKRISHKDGDLQVKNNYLGYSSKKYNQDAVKNSNEKYKGYQSKYDFLYGDNGEYSLYPNLDRRAVDADVARNYKEGEGENVRMVKRDAETMPGYDDEPNVFLEIPDIEYDLYK